MLYAVDGQQFRISRDREAYLQKLASRNGQRFGPIRSRNDYLKACIKALPPRQARQMLEWLERRR